MFLIDTNICIYAMRGKFPMVTQRIMEEYDNIFISSVSVGELEYGAAKSKWGVRSKRVLQTFLANFNIIPFDEMDAACAGKIRANLEFKGTPIGAYDIMIGAQGLVRDLTVVTHNTKEFCRIPNLRVEDWVH